MWADRCKENARNLQFGNNSKIANQLKRLQIGNYGKARRIMIVLIAIPMGNRWTQAILEMVKPANFCFLLFRFKVIWTILKH